MPSAWQILPLLAFARGTLEATFNEMVRLGKGIPCAAIGTYGQLREHLLVLERTVLEELKAAGVHPPEEAPRHPPMIPLCRGGESDATLGPEASTTKAGLQRKHDALLATWQKLYQSDAGFKARVDAAVSKLGPPGSKDIRALFQIFYLGGAPWNIVEAGKALEVTITRVSVEAILALIRGGLGLLGALREIAEARGLPTEGAAKKGRTWLWIGAGVGALVLAAGCTTWYLWGRSRSRGSGIIDAEVLEEIRS